MPEIRCRRFGDLFTARRCGDLFTARRSTARYCSGARRVAEHRRKARNRILDQRADHLAYASNLSLVR